MYNDEAARVPTAPSAPAQPSFPQATPIVPATNAPAPHHERKVTQNDVALFSADEDGPQIRWVHSSIPVAVIAVCRVGVRLAVTVTIAVVLQSMLLSLSLLLSLLVLLLMLLLLLSLLLFAIDVAGVGCCYRCV